VTQRLPVERIKQTAPLWHDLRVGRRLVGRYCPELRRLELFYRGDRGVFDLARLDAASGEQTNDALAG
jgi:hypothetical protein